MLKTQWTAAEVQKLFRIPERYSSKTTLLNAEQRGDIPEAHRVQRGSQKVRYWTLEQLPLIGQRYGFLAAPKRQHVICCYTAKGGVLKTTFAYTLARTLALHGIRTLVVGLDFQCSITDLALQPRELEDLSEYQDTNIPDLYGYLSNQVGIRDIIKKTDLPTLDIIPETPALIVLERAMFAETRREDVFKKKLIPHIDHDVVIFDTSPHWGLLIANGLVAASTVISPAGCDLGTFRALRVNLETIRGFQESADLSWENFFLVPTLRENTKMSQDIYKAYLTTYPGYIVPASIRRAIKGQESLVLNQTPFEHAPGAPLANDYYEIFTHIWPRIIGSEAASHAA